MPADVTARLLDVDNAIYGLDKYRGALASSSNSCYECIDAALYDSAGGGNVMWTGFTAPAGAPATVANGCLTRVFTYIANTIKTAAGYTMMIGEDLGVEGSVQAAPDPATTVPEFDLRITSGGKLEVVWTKGVFDGVKLEFDLGAGGMKTDIDLRPNYTLNWQPAAGTASTVKVLLRYLYKGEEFGQWSDWKSYTLAGA